MTVKELIENLQILNPELPIVINDADTSWLLNILSIVEEDKYVSLESNYTSKFKPKTK